MSKVRRYDNVYSNPQMLLVHFLNDVLEEMNMNVDKVEVSVNPLTNQATIMDEHDNVFIVRWIEGNDENDDEVIIDYSVYYEEPLEEKQII